MLANYIVEIRNPKIPGSITGTHLLTNTVGQNATVVPILHPRSLTACPLKNDGWKIILSFWHGLFSGANC